MYYTKFRIENQWLVSVGTGYDMKLQLNNMLFSEYVQHSEH